MKSGMRVLLNDPEMLLFPFLSATACLALVATFAAPFFLSEAWGWSKPNRETEQQVLFGTCWFASYTLIYFVMYFFNSATVACAIIRMQGGDPTLADGWRAAFARLPAIFGWALLAGSVGLILKLIESRGKRLGEFISGILGCAWTLASFLAVPVLVMERKGPIASLKESTRMLKNTWGEQLLGTVSFGVFFFLLNIPGLLLLIAAVALGLEHNNWSTFAGIAAAAALWFAVLGLIQSAVQCIYQSAVYLYARNGIVPHGFEPDALGGSVDVRAAA